MAYLRTNLVMRRGYSGEPVGPGGLSGVLDSILDAFRSAGDAIKQQGAQEQAAQDAQTQAQKDVKEAAAAQQAASTDDDTILGLPKTVVYLGGGAAAVYFLFLRKKKPKTT